jgi:hypothetical protein
MFLSCTSSQRQTVAIKNCPKQGHQGRAYGLFSWCYTEWLLLGWFPEERDVGLHSEFTRRCFSEVPGSSMKFQNIPSWLCMTSGSHGSNEWPSTKNSIITRSKRNPVRVEMSELSPGHELLDPFIYLAESQPAFLTSGKVKTSEHVCGTASINSLSSWAAYIT